MKSDWFLHMSSVLGKWNFFPVDSNSIPFLFSAGQCQTKAIAYGELGHIHRLLGNYEQAITCFKHEQELAKEPSLRTRLENRNGVIKSFNSNSNSDCDGKLNVGLFIEAEALHGLGC